MKNVEQFADKEIIDRVLKGEIALFELLIRRNNAFLYKTGRSYNYNHQDTEDLMQETFINAFTGLAKFEERSSFKAWIIKIMLNNCFKKRRKFSYKNEISNVIHDTTVPVFSSQQNNDTNKMVLNRELNCIIEDALKQLPEEYRLVFSLREINQLSVKETAEVMNISEANVKARLSRARVMLRKEIALVYQPEDIFEFNLVYCDAMVNRVMAKIKDSRYHLE